MVVTYLQIIVGYLLIVNISHFESSVRWLQSFDFLRLLWFFNSTYSQSFLLFRLVKYPSFSITSESAAFLSDGSTHWSSHISSLLLRHASLFHNFARSKSSRGRSMHFSAGVESTWWTSLLLLLLDLSWSRILQSNCQLSVCVFFIRIMQISTIGYQFLIPPNITASAGSSSVCISLISINGSSPTSQQLLVAAKRNLNPSELSIAFN